MAANSPVPATVATRQLPAMPAGFGGAAAGWAPASARRLVVLASADAVLRSELSRTLTAMRWEVREASGGAELFVRMEAQEVGAVLLDSWLPDLEVGECVAELRRLYPRLDVLALDGADIGAAQPVGPFRNELLHALRTAQPSSDDVAWKSAPSEARILESRTAVPVQTSAAIRGAGVREQQPGFGTAGRGLRAGDRGQGTARPVTPLPELLGDDPRMLELGRRIRLVAPRSTAVLVQGPTGTGKELVARAIHRLSSRASRPFIALNCAAIPEALLEAELFGHTRGAFTGAVQGRTGRLEAAHGGTLFLDEIGELPLALQAKLLRFVECGELQRVGENEPIRVDVRIVAATHRRLRTMAAEGSFRADLYYRLSVFLIQTPALGGRRDDIALLARHVLARLGEQEAAKAMTPAALERLLAHPWPGNVRELEHTLERAWILAGEGELIGVEEIDFGTGDDN